MEEQKRKTLDDFVFGCDDELKNGMWGKSVVYRYEDNGEIRLRVSVLFKDTNIRSYAFEEPEDQYVRKAQSLGDISVLFEKTLEKNRKHVEENRDWPCYSWDEKNKKYLDAMDDTISEVLSNLNEMPHHIEIMNRPSDFLPSEKNPCLYSRFGNEKRIKPVSVLGGGYYFIHDNTFYHGRNSESFGRIPRSSTILVRCLEGTGIQVYENKTLIDFLNNSEKNEIEKNEE